MTKPQFHNAFDRVNKINALVDKGETDLAAKLILGGPDEPELIPEELKLLDQGQVDNVVEETKRMLENRCQCAWKSAETCKHCDIPKGQARFEGR